MKHIFYSLLLLPLLGYAGGDIQPVEVNYDQVIQGENLEEAKVITEVVPERTEKVLPVASNYYIGLSTASTTVNGQSSTTVLKNGHPLALVGKLGYNLTDNIAIEGRAGVGIKKDTVDFASSEIESLAGVYLKPNINVTENINLSALLGYANIKQKIDNETLSTNGVSFGAEVDYKLTDAWTLAADAVRYGNKNSERVDAYSLGLNYNF
ncbi:porin family protein [bacterium]|nr:porin family protein [bacterium]MBU1959205.1 porin family protein [bacterium]